MARRRARRGARRSTPRRTPRSAAIARARRRPARRRARRILTHCNTGALAARRRAARRSPSILELRAARRACRVLACETRPLLQGARLTVWELARAGVAARAPRRRRRRRADPPRRGRRGRSSAATASPPTATSPTRSARTRSRSPRARPGSRSSSPARRRRSTPSLPDGDGIEIEERDADEVRCARRRADRRCRARRAQPGLRRHAGRARHRARHRARRRARRRPRGVGARRWLPMRVARSLTPREVRVEERPRSRRRARRGRLPRARLRGLRLGRQRRRTSRASCPRVLGHELVGEVTAVGAGVDGVAPGDRVVVHHHVPCGECRRCRRGHETLCEQLPRDRAGPGRLRRAGPRARRPRRRAARARRPRRRARDVRRAAGLRAARVRPRRACAPGDALLVVGAGSNGLLAIAAAHARGVDAVWVREPRAERLERAPRAGRRAPRRRARRRRVRVHRRRPRRSPTASPRARRPAACSASTRRPRPGRRSASTASALFLREVDVCASLLRRARRTCARRSTLIASGRDRPARRSSRTASGSSETGRALELQRTRRGAEGGRDAVRAPRCCTAPATCASRTSPSRAARCSSSVEAATTCGTDARCCATGT